MMDGRVKTLHPNVHAGILARRHRPEDLTALSARGITPIDLVVVNLYPFAKAAARPDIAFDDLIEEIDIGGPSLVRAAAKNFRDVLVVVDPADYSGVLAALASPGGPPVSFRFDLARKAIAHTADYDRMSAATLDAVQLDDASGKFSRDVSPARLPDAWRPRLVKIRDLRTAKIRTRWAPGMLSVKRASAPPSCIKAGTVVYEPARSGCGRPPGA
jgi:phosphoribosylaminoimidazolecarboxamide formyltransferase/IMP cyclohydrolase